MSPAASELNDPGLCSEHGLLPQSKDTQVSLIGESESWVDVSLSSVCPGCTCMSAAPQTMTQFHWTVVESSFFFVVISLSVFPQKSSRVVTSLCAILFYLFLEERCAVLSAAGTPHPVKIGSRVVWSEKAADSSQQTRQIFNRLSRPSNSIPLPTFRSWANAEALNHKVEMTLG